MDGHVKDTHSPKKVMCEHCDFQITSQEELNEHFTSKHGANCINCVKTKDELESLKEKSS